MHAAAVHEFEDGLQTILDDLCAEHHYIKRRSLKVTNS